MTTSKARPATSGTRGSWGRGNRSAMKLLGARRGDGLLICAELSIPAAYVIDVYAQGEAHTASGALEGDFSALVTDDADAEPRLASLRLDDGRELKIQLLDIEDSNADFDVKGDHPGADLLN